MYNVKKSPICIATIISLMILLFTPVFSVQATEFNRNYIISDEDLLDSSAMSLSEIQYFLKMKNSALAGFFTPDIYGVIKPASQIIADTAQRYGINPKFILVMLQKEQSLIEDPNPSPKQFDWAMGYGVCDNCSMNDPKLLIFKGFGAQVDKAISRVRWFYDNPFEFKQAGQEYIIDGHIVNPINQATALLYSYTPHIHGNYLFWKIWNRWFKQIHPDGSLLQVRGESGVWYIQYGFKRPILSRSALVSRFDPGKIIIVDRAELEKYETGSPIKFANYSLLKEPGGKIFLLVDDQLRHIDSMSTFRTIGFNPEEIIDVKTNELDSYAKGGSITINSTYPVGALLQNNVTGAVYFVQDGIKHPLIAREIMTINYPRYQIISVSPNELDKYSNGELIRFREGELLKTPTSPVVYVISNQSRRPIVSEEVFKKLGYSWDNIKIVSDTALSNLPLGEYINLSFKDQM